MKLLDYIMATREAQNEEDVEALLTITNPALSDREKMEESYEELLGYNPCTAFDEYDLAKEFDAIYEVAPINVQEKLDLKRDEILEKCLKCVGEVREDLLGSITAQAIKVETGWMDPELEYELPLAIIRFLSGEEDGFEIDPDDIVSDDETNEDEDDDYDSSDEEEDDELNLDLAEMLGDDVD